MTALDLAPQTARAALIRVCDLSGLDDEVVADRFARALWSGIAEPGDSVAGRLIADVGAVAALRTILDRGARNEAVSAAELDAGRRRWLPRAESPALRDGLRAAGASDVRLTFPGDGLWPVHVDDLGPHAPLCLWVRGEPSLLARLHPSAAVVGARASTTYGEHVAMELAADLAGSGVAIVSGAAYGIDGAAHRAALSVGGVTIALLAGGADRAYPAGHTGLLDRIARVGAVVSEVPCGSTPTKWRFLQRNRLIAALSGVTVVVEAGWRSGSLNTAHHAQDLGRPLGAVPGPITSAASAGVHRLLREGAAQCITSGDDVRELLGLSTTAAPPAGRDERPRTDAATRVRDALSARSWRDASDLARRSGMARDEIEAVLGILHLDGAVQRSAAGWRAVSGAGARA